MIVRGLVEEVHQDARPGLYTVLRAALERQRRGVVLVARRLERSHRFAASERARGVHLLAGLLVDLHALGLGLRVVRVVRVRVGFGVLHRRVHGGPARGANHHVLRRRILPLRGALHFALGRAGPGAGRSGRLRGHRWRRGRRARHTSRPSLPRNARRGVRLVPEPIKIWREQISIVVKFEPSGLANRRKLWECLCQGHTPSVLRR